MIEFNLRQGDNWMKNVSVEQTEKLNYLSVISL